MAGYTSGKVQYTDHCQCGSMPEEHSRGDYQPHGFFPFELPPREDANPLLVMLRRSIDEGDEFALENALALSTGHPLLSIATEGQREHARSVLTRLFALAVS